MRSTWSLKGLPRHYVILTELVLIAMNRGIGQILGVGDRSGELSSCTVYIVTLRSNGQWKRVSIQYSLLRLECGCEVVNTCKRTICTRLITRSVFDSTNWFRISLSSTRARCDEAPSGISELLYDCSVQYYFIALPFEELMYIQKQFLKNFCSGPYVSSTYKNVL